MAKTAADYGLTPRTSQRPRITKSSRTSATLAQVNHNAEAVPLSPIARAQREQTLLAAADKVITRHIKVITRLKDR